jgi:Cof subfamily protein (haloacid dehalogenase superfamily)
MALQPNKVKIIFFDVDDTLRLKDAQWMPPSVPGVFRRLRERGYKTGIASGRAYYGIVPEVRALGADYYVTINGQRVETADNREIFRRPIPPPVVERFVAWTREISIDYGLVGEQRAVVSRWNKFSADAITPVYGTLAEEGDFWQTNHIYQLWTFTDRDLDRALPPDLQRNVRLIRWHPYSYDVVPLQGSKAEGIAKVLDVLHLTAEDLMVFGDGLNDLEMFQFAGFSVAMGNACPEVKRLADFVTRPIDEDGVQYALETLGLI